MRELTQMELEQVDGGLAPALVIPIVIGVVVLAGFTLLGYAVYKNCSGSMELGDNGLSIEVTCPGGVPVPGGG